MSAHTPGPWEIYQPQTYHYIRSVAPETLGHYVMDHAGGPTGAGYARSEADARLIAAAPDLLEACAAALAVGEIHFETCVLSKSVKRRLLAAIAKAEGR